MYVCGQKNLLSKINHLIEEDRFPRFSIIVGDTGYGKKVICDYIAKQLGALFIPCELKVDDVRQVIEDSYTVTEKSLYMFADCDNMSVNSKNALLKVTEEPPNNSYFVMTVRDINNLLNTLISRGTVFNVEPYTKLDIQDYIQYRNYSFTKDVSDIITDICVCPQDVITANSINIKDIYELADKFIQFIGSANLGNELKISTLLSTKKDDEKIDPVIFLRCVMLKCDNYLINDLSSLNTETIKKLHNIIKVTSIYQSEINKKGSNKQMLLDNWIVSTHMAITGGEF